MLRPRVDVEKVCVILSFVSVHHRVYAMLLRPPLRPSSQTQHATFSPPLPLSLLHPIVSPSCSTLLSYPVTITSFTLSSPPPPLGLCLFFVLYFYPFAPYSLRPTASALLSPTSLLFSVAVSSSSCFMPPLSPLFLRSCSLFLKNFPGMTFLT